MTRLRVVCSRPDRQVSIVIPAPECVKILRHGYVKAHKKCFGMAVSPLDRDREIAKILHGDRPGGVSDYFSAPIDTVAPECMFRLGWPDSERIALAHRWVDAVIAGGLLERDAVSLIGERDAPPYSGALEIVDMDDLPDRKYRDAWRRSTNGGPIEIDEVAKREIDFLLYINSTREARKALDVADMRRTFIQ